MVGVEAGDVDGFAADGGDDPEVEGTALAAAGVGDPLAVGGPFVVTAAGAAPVGAGDAGDAAGFGVGETWRHLNPCWMCCALMALTLKQK